MSPETSPLNPPESKRDKLRAMTLGTALNQKTQLVDVGDGEKLEVRKLTIAQSRYIQRTAVKKNGDTDETRAAVLTVIFSTYVPGSNQLVYEEKDEDELMSKSVDDWVERLFDAVAAVNKRAAPEEVEKNSGRT